MQGIWFVCEDDQLLFYHCFFNGELSNDQNRSGEFIRSIKI